jgi:hypothetical protein
MNTCKVSTYLVVDGQATILEAHTGVVEVEFSLDMRYMLGR